MKRREFDIQYAGLESFISDMRATYQQYHCIEDFYMYFQRYHFFVIAHSHELTPAQRKQIDNMHKAGLIALLNEYKDRYNRK